MWGHRKDLIGRLNHVLSRFKGVDEDYNQRRNKVEYRRLLDVLMGADRRTMEILTGTPLKLILLCHYTDPVGTYSVPLNLHLCIAFAMIRRCGCIMSLLGGSRRHWTRRTARSVLFFLS